MIVNINIVSGNSLYDKLVKQFRCHCTYVSVSVGKIGWGRKKNVLKEI